MDERSTMVTLDGKQYELVFSTKAMKEINSRYKWKKPGDMYKETTADMNDGAADKSADESSESLEAFNDELHNSDKFNSVTDDFIWLLTLLLNQGIARHNIGVIRAQSGVKIAPFSEEEVEVLTDPADFSTYKRAINEAIHKGMTRNVRSEDNPKNVMTG